MDKTTVLIVEDEAIVAMDLAGKLKRLGYEIAGIVDTGEEAVEQACRLKPHVVLMDIQLKGKMDGIEAYHAISDRHNAPVIYLTAHSDTATLERAKLSGPFGFILKPFEERALSTTIEMALYKHQADRQLREQQEALRRANEELEGRVEERTRELKSANEAIKAERQRLYEVLETLPVYVVLLDSDYRVPFANRFFRERFGESNGRRCYEYLFNRTGPCETCETYRVMETKAPHHWYWTGPDGRDYDIYDNPLVDSGGSTMILEMGIDISEQKKAQESLRELNELLEERVKERTAQLTAATEKLRDSRVAALNLMEDALVARGEAERANEELRREIEERKRAEDELRRNREDLDRAQEVGQIGSWRLDIRSNVLIWSDENHRIFGLPKGTPLSYETFLSTVHPDDREYVDTRWKAGLAGEPYDIEHRIVVAGVVKWVREKAFLEIGDDGTLLGGFGITQDISERKRAEEDLHSAKEAAETANRAKSLFLANMSHELRTPMTGVLGMLEIARKGRLSDRQREAVDIAHKSGQSLLVIINDILDLTRIESGKLAIEEDFFLLRECVSGAMDIVTPEARRKGLDLSCSITEGSPETLVGDRVRIQQVLTNLLGNAVKFTEKGEVKLKVEADGKTQDGRSKLVFSVTDTGIGISEENRGIIFQAFCQADESHTRQYGGTGLGLSISRELVNLMGGEISCESREGEGSSFSFTIPIREAVHEPAASIVEEAPLDIDAAVSSAEKGKRARLLVAEDDEVTRKVLGFMLGQSGFDFEFAGDGLQVVEMWEKGEYDLIVMDGQMPRMDGFTAARAIRERETIRGGHIPIVAMTAHALKEDEERCLAAGMDAYVSKPIDFKRCIKVISGLLEGGGQGVDS